MPEEVPPPKGPLRGWFAKLSPEVRAALILAAGIALNIAWSKFLPGVPPPQLTPPAPVVVNNVLPPPDATK